MEKPGLLIVEDDEVIRAQMKWSLAEEYDISMAADRERAVSLARAGRPSLVLLDLGLPPHPRGAEEGLRTLAEILALDREAKVIVVSGNQEKANALEAIGMGAFDFFLKPADMDEVRTVLRRALHIATLERENVARKEGIPRPEFSEIVGESPSIRRIFEVIRKVAATDASVLIEGESGTGKELISRAIHRASRRRQDRFVAINCGAIPENLIESELFGHEKGAFTGADSQKRGRIEFADQGTLFLDEVGELPLALQVKLLRFLQERQVERVGGRETIPVDVRVIAATNRDLKAETGSGRFREDLYYRLGVVTVKIPPLREREEDAERLAGAFLADFSSKYRKPLKGFAPDALRGIRSYGWPGNVRELENRVKRAVIMSEGKYLTAGDLELPETAPAPTESLRGVREKTERDHIRRALVRQSWNISRAALELGVSRPTLHDMIRKYRIEKDD